MAMLELVSRLGLAIHPVENGYFREMYRSSANTVLDGREFSLATTAYFLYEEGQFSPWHRMLHSEEVWIHQAGGGMKIHVLLVSDDSPDDVSYFCHVLQNQNSIVVPPCAWYAAEPLPGSEYVLATVLLSPGFDPSDFEIADITASLDRISGVDACDIEKLKTLVKRLN